MEQNNYIVPFKCDKCGCDFAFDAGGRCVNCGRLLCNKCMKIKIKPEGAGENIICDDCNIHKTPNEKESIFTRYKWIITGILLLPAIVTTILYIKEMFGVDICLDQGGSYNYLSGACDKTISHPYISFISRHIIMIGISAIGVGVQAIIIFIAKLKSNIMAS